HTAFLPLLLSLHDALPICIFHKTLVLFVALIALYVLLIFGSLPIWANVIMCVLMGFTFAFIGFNVMHDGGHGSYSDKRWLNTIRSEEHTSELQSPENLVCR